MEEFLPGLVKVMEERLGRFGRPLTTIVVISLALGACAWGIKLFVDNAVSPIYKVILSLMNIQGLSVEEFITPFVIYIALLIVISLIFYILYRKTIVKRAMQSANEAIKQAEQIISEAEERIKQTEEVTQKAQKLLIELKRESKSDIQYSQTE